MCVDPHAILDTYGNRWHWSRFERDKIGRTQISAKNCCTMIPSLLTSNWPYRQVEKLQWPCIGRACKCPKLNMYICLRISSMKRFFLRKNYYAMGNMTYWLISLHIIKGIDSSIIKFVNKQVQNATKSYVKDCLREIKQQEKILINIL